MSFRSGCATAWRKDRRRAHGCFPPGRSAETLMEEGMSEAELERHLALVRERIAVARRELEHLERALAVKVSTEDRRWNEDTAR
jgi:hypothetical protein